MFASLVILIVGMAGLGWWMGLQIENSVIHETAAYTALYVSSIVEPNLQELATGDAITPEHQAMIDQALQETSLGHSITAIKIWDKEGRIVYATDAANLGLTLPVDDQLASALRGWVAADISNLTKPENVHDSDRGKRRLETYSPVRRTGTNQIIAAVEFYQTVDDLDRAIAAARERCWLTVGAVTVGMYLLLAGFVRRVSDTISRQQSELSSQVVRLKDVLTQNQELHERVRRAAERTTALNERFLRRNSAELHDGPAQDLGLALLRLENLEPCTEAAQIALPATSRADFNVVQSSLQNALKEIRAISAGMGMPELGHLTLADTVARAVHAHERRTGTQVTVSTAGLAQDASLPVKITVYRFIQEALTNAYRHAGGIDQQVRVTCLGGELELMVSDGGPGFDDAPAPERDDHLGLVGMRERVESLGGTFILRSAPGQGTRVLAHLPLEPAQKEGDNDR
jgi:signal transduction histidine kinase